MKLNEAVLFSKARVVPTRSTTPAAVEKPAVEVTRDTYIVRATDTSSGKEIWKRTFPMTMFRPPTQPDADTVTIFDANDHTLRALEADSGKQRWKIGVGDLLLGQPSAVAPGLFLIARAFGDLHALDGATGERRWDQRFEKGFSHCSRGEQLWVQSGSRLFRLDPENGERLAEQEAPHRGKLVASEKFLGLYEGSRFTLLDPQTLRVAGHFQADAKVVEAREQGDGFLLKHADGGHSLVEPERLALAPEFEPTFAFHENCIEVGDIQIDR